MIKVKGLDDGLRAVLDQSGLPWEIDHGSRHAKLYVAGRLVGVLPRGTTGHHRGYLNQLANVRRRIKEITAR